MSMYTRVYSLKSLYVVLVLIFELLNFVSQKVMYVNIILQIDEMGERVPPELDPKDERLLEEDYSDKTDVKRSMR